MNNQEISKFIALILRHKPETIGISLDEHGWVTSRQAGRFYYRYKEYEF